MHRSLFRRVRVRAFMGGSASCPEHDMQRDAFGANARDKPLCSVLTRRYMSLTMSVLAVVRMFCSYPYLRRRACTQSTQHTRGESGEWSMDEERGRESMHRTGECACTYVSRIPRMVARNSRNSACAWSVRILPSTTFNSTCSFMASNTV